MTDAQARSFVGAVALLISVAIAALVWGRGAVDVVLVVALLWHFWDRITVHELVDQALDVADQAVGRVEAVENHLTGLEPPALGRHAKSSSLHPLPRRNPS